MRTGLIFHVRLQWTGINTIIFYAPQLFITLGASQSAALAATIVTGVVNHLATYVSLWAADEFGRRVLFIEGGVQMTFALVSSGWLVRRPHILFMNISNNEQEEDFICK